MTSYRSLGLSLALGSLFALAAGCSSSADDAAVAGSDLTMDELPVRMTDLAAGTFEQVIDHGAESEGKFKQRYWYSTQFAKGADAPVIFMFCGESECSPAHMTALADVAKTLGAATVALEHRYYGKSLPFEKPTLDQMKHLTIHNALEDAVAFEAFAKSELGLKGKWIAVGGSYPGMLAAFYRAKHPDLVVGAWASSAPVDMQESFSGYDQVTARALGPECAGRFRTALAAVDAAFDVPATWDALTTRAYGRPLTIPTGLDEATRLQVKASYLYNFSGIAMQAVQKGRSGLLCSALAQHADEPLEGVIGFHRPPLVAEETDKPATPANDDAVTSTGPGSEGTAKGTEIPTDPPIGETLYEGRAWDYQTCTEVGFFMIPNPNREESIMSSLVTADASLARCRAQAQQLPKIAETRAAYLDPINAGTASNLFFVNGSNDPWSSLSYNDQATAPAGVTTHVVAKGTHCSDMSNLTPNSTLGVFEAHVKFNQLAKQWLAAP